MIQQTNKKLKQKKRQSKKKLREEISVQNQKIQQQIQLITELQSQLAQYQSQNEELVASSPSRVEVKRRGAFLSKSGNTKQDSESNSSPSDPAPRKASTGQNNMSMGLSDSTDMEEQFREYSGKGNIEEMKKLVKLGVHINSKDDR